MKRFILHLAFVPVWLLTLAILPCLPKSHPWKGQRMTLTSWVDHGTQQALDISVIFWSQIVALIYLGWLITR